MTDNGSPLIFVTVGTDHHAFNRLIQWVDSWLEAGGKDKASCFLQIGTSLAPKWGEYKEYLGYEEMVAVTKKASLVVCHGGPGSIVLCRYFGKKPIVVARRRHFGEAVDDHQSLFTQRIANEGEIDLAETQAELFALLDDLLRQPRNPAPVRIRGDSSHATKRFQELVGMLTGRGVSSNA